MWLSTLINMDVTNFKKKKKICITQLIFYSKYINNYKLGQMDPTLLLQGSQSESFNTKTKSSLIYILPKGARSSTNFNTPFFGDYQQCCQ